MDARRGEGSTIRVEERCEIIVAETWLLGGSVLSLAKRACAGECVRAGELPDSSDERVVLSPNWFRKRVRQLTGWGDISKQIRHERSGACRLGGRSVGQAGWTG
jgi:hypothetical protein